MQKTTKMFIAVLAAALITHPDTILAKGSKSEDAIATLLQNMEEAKHVPYYEETELLNELIAETSGVDYFNPKKYALDIIGKLESENRYNVINGGSYFHDFSKHPKICRRLADGKCSTAAGRYQITFSTWNYYVKKMKQSGITIADFSPKAQDMVAWHIAVDQYGGNLESDLITKDKHSVMRKLQGTWLALRKLPVKTT